MILGHEGISPSGWIRCLEDIDMKRRIVVMAILVCASFGHSADLCEAVILHEPGFTDRLFAPTTGALPRGQFVVAPNGSLYSTMDIASAGTMTAKL